MADTKIIEVPDAIVKRAAESRVFDYEFVAPDWKLIENSEERRTREGATHSVVLQHIESGRFFRVYYHHYYYDDLIQIHSLARARVEVFPHTAIVYKSKDEV